MSVTSLHIPYKEKLEPIVKHLEYVAVADDMDESRWRYYRVMYIEPLLVRVSTPTIPNGGSVDLEVPALELHENVLGQVRIVELTDGFEVEVRLPAATRRYSTKNVVGRIDSFIVNNYPQLTEVFYIGDNEPRFTVFNNSGADGSATIRFAGFKYILEPVSGRPERFTVVYVSTVVPGR